MSNKIELTAELYEANIPKCCLYQSMEQHTEDLMMCWSLASSIKNNEPMDCGFCELNTLVTKQQRDEHYAKLKTFSILRDQ